jgi:hypothetical protein
LGLSLAVLERTTQTKVRVTGKGAVEMRIVIVNLLVLVLLSGVAFAGSLATDPNALYYDGTTWCGTTVVSSDGLDANMDYCVYGPGQFSYPGLGYTPTPGEFVYAYQVFVTGEIEVITFFVGLDVGNQANNIGTWSMSGGMEPDTLEISGTPPDTAFWQWDDPTMQPGSKSVGLAFSSVNAPEWYAGAVANGGDAVVGDLPSPSDVIPEPGTVALLLAGAIAGGWRRNRRARLA